MEYFIFHSMLSESKATIMVSLEEARAPLDHNFLINFIQVNTIQLNCVGCNYSFYVMQNSTVTQYNTMRDKPNKSNIIATHCEKAFSVHFMKGLRHLI